jgi:hypothetical protein
MSHLDAHPPQNRRRATAWPAGSQRLQRLAAQPTPIQRISRALGRVSSAPADARNVGGEEVVSGYHRRIYRRGNLRCQSRLPGAARPIEGNDDRSPRLHVDDAESLEDHLDSVRARVA